ncbi:MAG TPA: ABC transporter ATP-binding protein [Polyangiaceae bacterium]|nr:ABC transporter ATP-binding protein [Polyangiaceae bacterium]
MLEVRDVTVRAGSRALLEGVSFAAEAGEIVGVIGPNGAGKTTLLEALVGLRRTGSAVVTFRGERLSSFHDRARTFAFLPDAAELAFELDVRALVTHALRFRPRPAELVDELRDALRIADLLEAPAGVLSRGERQRVALFCALAVDRPVVVLDEPFNAFDPLQLREVLGAVRRVSEAGAAVVATVHQLRDAQKIATLIVEAAGVPILDWSMPPYSGFPFVAEGVRRTVLVVLAYLVMPLGLLTTGALFTRRRSVR